MVPKLHVQFFSDIPSIRNKKRTAILYNLKNLIPFTEEATPWLKQRRSPKQKNNLKSEPNNSLLQSSNILSHMFNYYHPCNKGL